MLTANDYFDEGAKLEKSGYLEGAEEAYLSALEEKPGFIKAIVALAGIYNMTSNWEQGERLLLELVSIHPSEENYYKLAVFQLKKGDPSKAVQSFRKSISLNKFYLNSHLELAKFYQKVGNEYKEEIYLINVFRIDNKHKYALNRLLNIYIKNSRLPEALHLLVKLQELYPEDFSKTRKAEVQILLKMGKFAQAKELLQEGLERDPSVFRIQNGINDDPMLQERIARVLQNKLHFLKTHFSGTEEKPSHSLAVEVSILSLLLGKNSHAAKYLVYATQLSDISKANSIE
ncbi:MAG: hypothetical protein SFU98_08865 [Leptospiraceae bacterium]|nr:hypothetical protein [Leptospiraceae bacterium]